MMAAALLSLVNVDAIASTTTPKKSTCPKTFPGAAAFAEDIARNIETNASSVVIETTGDLQKKLALSKVKIKLSKPEVKLTRGDGTPVDPPTVTIDGAETSGKTVLGNHATVSLPASGQTEYTVALTDPVDGSAYKCQYTFTARITGKAYKVWKEGDRDRSERISNFKFAQLSNLVKSVPFFAVAGKPRR